MFNLIYYGTIAVALALVGFLVLLYGAIIITHLI
jgi:hypothetical protein